MLSSMETKCWHGNDNVVELAVFWGKQKRPCDSILFLGDFAAAHFTKQHNETKKSCSLCILNFYHCEWSRSCCPCMRAVFVSPLALCHTKRRLDDSLPGWLGISKHSPLLLVVSREMRRQGKGSGRFNNCEDRPRVDIHAPRLPQKHYGFGPKSSVT